MFAKYKNNIYRFIENIREKHYITGYVSVPVTAKYMISTSLRDKSLDGFTEVNKYGKSSYFKDVEITNCDLSDVYDVELWVKYDCGYPVFSKEWEIALSGTFLVDGKLVLEANGDIPGWFRPEKHVSRNNIPLKDIESAWILHKYLKKDGVVLNEPLIIHEDISVEKLVELRNYYSRKL